MSIWRGALLVALLALARAASADTSFMAVDVYVQSDQPLAAWQFEFSDQNKATRIVGIENGDSRVFHPAPYYDRDALARGDAERVVVADYSLAGRRELPTGRIRVATLHLMVSGDTDFASSLIVATTHGGKSIEAEISVEISAGREE